MSENFIWNAFYSTGDPMYYVYLKSKRLSEELQENKTDAEKEKSGERDIPQ